MLEDSPVGSLMRCGVCKLTTCEVVSLDVLVWWLVATQKVTMCEFTTL